MQQTVGFLRCQLTDRNPGPEAYDLSDILRRNRNAVIFAFFPLPFGFGQLLPDRSCLIPDFRSPFILLRSNRSFLFAVKLLKLFFEFLDCIRHGNGLHANLGSSFVHEINGLIRQKAVRNITMGQLHGCFNRLILDLCAMERFIFVPQTKKDLNGILCAWFADHDGLEAPLQSRVLFNVFFVFVERGCADDLNLPTGKRRLQDIRSIDGALGSSGTNERMHFIDKKNDIAIRRDLINDALQTFLEFPTVFRTRDKGSHRQRNHALFLQHMRHDSLLDALGKPLSNRRLAHTRLTDEDWIVLRAPRQDLDHALNFLFPADDRIHFILRGHLVEIASELVQ